MTTQVKITSNLDSMFTNSGLSKIRLTCMSDLLELTCCVNRGVSVPKIGRNVLLRSFASLTVYSSEILFLVKLRVHNVTTQLTEILTVAATTVPSLIKERNLNTKDRTHWNYETLALKTSYPFCTSVFPNLCETAARWIFFLYKTRARTQQIYS